MKTTIRILLFLAIALVASAADIKLTRSQASELYQSLGSCEQGVNPTNAVIIADNLIQLRPEVEKLDKARVSRDRLFRALLADKSVPDNAKQAKADKIGEQYDAEADKELVFKLKPFALSDDEVRDSKLRPAALSVIRRWLWVVKEEKP